MEFFRHCPGCGRRFHIKLVGKKLARLERETRPKNQGPFQGPLTVSQFRAAPLLLLQESAKPVVVDVEEFQYSYKCKHCGHEWSEKHFEEHQER